MQIVLTRPVSTCRSGQVTANVRQHVGFAVQCHQRVSALRRASSSHARIPRFGDVVHLQQLKSSPASFKSQVGKSPPRTALTGHSHRHSVHGTAWPVSGFKPLVWQTVASTRQVLSVSVGATSNRLSALPVIFLTLIKPYQVNRQLSPRATSNTVLPNPSLEPTRSGVALGPRGRSTYPRPRGPSATPTLAAQLKR